MKTIGLIGGTSWVSTIDYYKAINQLINEKLGGTNFAQLLLYSINFEEFKKLADVNDLNGLAKLYIAIAKKLETAGAECIVICANTPHIVADVVQKEISIPLIHIANETGKEISKYNIQTAGLLGTKFVMEDTFFKEKLINYGITTVIPDEEERTFIHTSIFTELTKGIFSEETKTRYLVIIDRLIKQGAEGIIFACTEIPILLKGYISPVATFDTTLIHAQATVDFSLKDEHNA